MTVRKKKTVLKRVDVKFRIGIGVGFDRSLFSSSSTTG